MPITFRYDAAAVVPPSNEATRKYGQALVLQQQQQKYQGQQQAMDRQFQLGRDWQQNAFQANRQAGQNQFQADRDIWQNAQNMARDTTRLQQQEADRQRAFLDDARKQSSGMIMADIENGEYDPVTARKLKQSLVDEAETLGDPTLDATQRADTLGKIRARRAMLSANRQVKPPKPTREDELKNFLGSNYDSLKDHTWVPDGKGTGGFVIADVPQPPPKQPTSFDEYSQQQPEKANKELGSAIAAIEESVADDETPLPDGVKKGSPEAAKWVEDRAYEQLDRPYAASRNRNPSPTQAPDISSGVVPAAPGPMQSILEAPAADIPITPPDEGRPPSPPIPTSGRQEIPLTSNSTSQNPWSEVAGIQPPTPPWDNADKIQQLKDQMDVRTMDNGQKVVPAPLARPGVDYSSTVPAPLGPPVQRPSGDTPATPTQSSELDATSGLPKVAPPDFGALASSATDADDKAFVRNMQEAYNGKSPDIQNAIGVLVNPESSEPEAGRALAYLQSKGIDPMQLKHPDRAEKIRGVQEKNKERFGNRRDLTSGF